MTALLLAAILTVGGFADTFKCRIEGIAYGMPGERSTLQRTDGCVLIAGNSDGKVVVLSSKWYWVAIDLPTDGGNQSFYYNWGSERFFLRGEPKPIKGWGKVGRG